MTTSSRKRTAVLISGRGSNMSALIAASMDPAYPARITGVISNVAAAPGLETARSHSIRAEAIPHGDFDGREAHDDAVHAMLTEMKAEIVCCAGYMRIMGEALVKRWAGRMINIHPALLPSFKGLNTHARALQAGVRIHGCSVHFVTPGMDEGPIIAQAAVPVHPGDSEDALAARVLAAEHRIYPMALKLVAQGKARMSAGRAVFADNGSEATGETVLISPGERRG